MTIGVLSRFGAFRMCSVVGFVFVHGSLDYLDTAWMILEKKSDKHISFAISHRATMRAV